MAKHKRAAGSTRALEVLSEAKVDYVVHEYHHDAAAKSFGMEAAEQLGVEPGRMFKTLMVCCDSGEYLVAVVPADHRLSLKSIAKAAGHRNAEMADPQVAQRRTGYVVGGISPLGQMTSHRTFLDETVLEYETIVVSAGKRGLSVELSPLDLAELTSAELADLKAL